MDICRRMLSKFSRSADRPSCGAEDGEWLAIPTKVSVVGGAQTSYAARVTAKNYAHNVITHSHTQLIKIEDTATLNHIVETVMFTVKKRQSKKCRTVLMISDARVELVLNEKVSSGHT